MEGTGFADAGAEAVDDGGNGIVGGTADKKDHERGFAGGVDTGGDADTLHAGLEHLLIGVSSVDLLGACVFGGGERVHERRLGESALELGGLLGSEGATVRHEIGFDDAGADAVNLRGDVGARLTLGDEEDDRGIVRIVAAGAEAEGLHCGMSEEFCRVRIAGGSGLLHRLRRDGDRSLGAD